MKAVWNITINCVAGFLFALFNFDGFLRYIARNWISNDAITSTMVTVSYWPRNLINATGFSEIELLNRGLTIGLYGIIVYFVFMVVLTRVRRDLRITTSTILGLVTGLTSIAILSWLVMAIIAIVRLLIQFWGVLVFWWSRVLAFLMPIWEFLAPYLSMAFLAIVGIAAAIGAFTVLVGIVKFIWEELGIKGFVVPAVVVGLTIWFWDYAMQIWEFIWKYLGPIFGWIASMISLLWSYFYAVLSWLIRMVVPLSIFLSIVGLTLLSLGTLGSMFLGEFRAAWKNSEGPREILENAFGIGLALALVMWSSSVSTETAAVVDGIWHNVLFVSQNISASSFFLMSLPDSVRVFSHNLFLSTDPQVFDVVILLAVLGISFIGIWRRLDNRPTEDSAEALPFSVYFSQDVILIGGVLAMSVPAVLLFILIAMAPREE